MSGLGALTTGCPKIDGPLARGVKIARTTVRQMALHRDLAAGHRLVFNVQVTKPGNLTQALVGLQKSFSEKCAKRANDMSVIAKFHVLRTLSHAVGMTSGKISQV